MDPLDRVRLRAIAKEAIDQADPIGLLEIGCPDDEYDPEVDRVLALVLESSDPGSLRQPFDAAQDRAQGRLLGERIYQVFVEMFDERIAGPPAVCGHIAQQIVEAMKEEGAENGSWKVDGRRAV